MVTKNISFGNVDSAIPGVLHETNSIVPGGGQVPKRVQVESNNSNLCTTLSLKIRFVECLIMVMPPKFCLDNCITTRARNMFYKLIMPLKFTWQDII